MGAADPARDFEWRQPGSYWLVTRAALLHPREYFASLTGLRGWGPPLFFLLVTHLVPALVRLGLQLWQGALAPVAWVLSLLASLAQALVAAGLIYLAARWVMHSAIRPETMLRVFAYAGGIVIASCLAAFMPAPANGIFLAVLTIVHLYLVMIGLQSAGDIPMPLAAACLIMALTAVLLGSALWGGLG